jgi:hypothetical protein
MVLQATEMLEMCFQWHACSAEARELSTPIAISSKRPSASIVQPDCSSFKTYQRVLLPESVEVSYSGSEGTTVGRGATELEASRPEVAVAKACTGSTIMLKVA